MKIAIVAGDLFVGGSQRYLSSLANHWNYLGFEVFIILLRQGEVHYDLHKNINLKKLSYDHTRKKVGAFQTINTLLQLRKKLKEIDAEVVLSNLCTTNLLTIAASYNLDHILYIRDAFSHTRKRGWFVKYLRKKLYPRATGIIAQTKEIKEHTRIETGQENIRVIKNPVRIISRCPKPVREKIIINVGALIGRKGQGHIIDVCEKLNDPSWKFVILGEGDQRAKLEAKIIEKKLQDRISLLGTVKNVDEWLLKSSIFVFPSSLEGLPNALIEAMRAGLACVSFDCETGPRDLITNEKNGFLVPVGHTAKLYDRIKQLTENEDLRNQIGVKAIITTENLGIDNISDEILDFFGTRDLEKSTLNKPIIKYQ